MSIAEIVEGVVDGPITIGLRAYDGSFPGPTDPPRTLHLQPRAASYLATAPGELGPARAYVAGTWRSRAAIRAIPTTCSSTSRPAVPPADGRRRRRARPHPRGQGPHPTPAAAAGGPPRWRRHEGCGTRCPATPAPSATTTTCRTGPTSTSSGRR